jgi:nitroimidazol reductase NimA-like FMN-containing flavoprotein (pyridoxamine 5'-phosphate oxidase superfamily)
MVIKRIDHKNNAPNSTAPSTYTKVKRLPERARYARADLYAVLDAATHCHVAHIADGRVICTPTLHWRINDRVYWHGSRVSRMLKSNAADGQVCLTATLMDGWVLARSAFNHSANYRAAMCFGQPEVLQSDEEKTRALEVLTEHWFPGRWASLRPMTRKELAATSVLSMPLDMASAKIREGGPEDPTSDRPWPVWAGVVPIQHKLGAPIPDVPLKRGVAPARVRVHGQQLPSKVVAPKGASPRTSP